MHVAIIGNGITGVTAALRLRELQPDWRITMISGESQYHYSRPALMYVYMGHMTYQNTKPYEDDFWPANRIDLVRDWVTRIDTEHKQLEMHRGPALPWDALLIATGSKSNMFGWPGQDLDGVQGLYSLMDLKQLYDSSQRAERAVIVGGGLIGIELAEMLHSRHMHVSILVRESSYWSNIMPAEESQMINRYIRESGMDLRLNTELAEIVDDGSGRACAVVTKGGERIDCQIVGLTAGVSPNTAVVEGSSIEKGRGILVDWQLRTGTPDVFAAGDCAEIATAGDARNVIQQVWYTGKMQGRVVAENIAGGTTRYDPGIWYNSAKFLDLEYQTYGLVPSSANAENSLYWEHPNGRHALRLVHENGVLKAINVMGLRYRHEVCERWIAEKLRLEEILGRLPEANFDPEFTDRFELEIERQLRAHMQEVV